MHAHVYIKGNITLKYFLYRHIVKFDRNTHTHTHTHVHAHAHTQRPSWILSGKVKPIWIYCSKR